MREQITTRRGLLGMRIKWINPVLNKEFRLRMRSAKAMWTLFFYLFAVGLLSFSTIMVVHGTSGSGVAFNPEESKVLFYSLSLGQLGLIAFMAPGLTAGIISGEREKQTLNLLLTTQQSSATIILSKLVSSLSFMLVIVVSTLPIYCMMFLYGGVSPKQLILVFLFYLFIMVVLGAFGVLFSTVMKRTMISVIVTYGVTLFIFAGTALIFFISMSYMQQINYGQGTVSQSYNWEGHIIALNPVAALLSVLDPSITDEVYGMRRGGTTTNSNYLQLWQEFMIVYGAIAIGALWIAIRNLRPRLRVKQQSRKSKL